MKPNWIVLHHSGDDISIPRFDIINNHHRMLGFPQSRLGYFGGYHYLIDSDGKTKRYRYDDEVGAHARQRLMNFRSIGICVAGNFSDENPPKSWQTRELQKLVLHLQRRHGIKSKNILLHNELRATKCPGIDWREFIRMEDPDVEETTGSKRIKENVFRRLMRRMKHFRDLP